MKHLTDDLDHSSLGFWFWFWLKSDEKVLYFSLIYSICVYLASDSRFLIFPYFLSFNFCQETSFRPRTVSLASALQFFFISTPELFLSGFCILIGNGSIVFHHVDGLCNHSLLRNTGGVSNFLILWQMPQLRSSRINFSTSLIIFSGQISRMELSQRVWPLS